MAVWRGKNGNQVYSCDSCYIKKCYLTVTTGLKLGYSLTCREPYWFTIAEVRAKSRYGQSGNRSG